MGRLVTATLVFQVAAALLTGATLSTPRCSVGPYRLATDAGDGARFACLDLQGAVVDAHEVWKCTVIRELTELERRKIAALKARGWTVSMAPPEFEQRLAHDWTAFVERELRYSRHSVEIALKDLERNRAIGTNAGRDPGPPYSVPETRGSLDRLVDVSRGRRGERRLGER